MKYNKNEIIGRMRDRIIIQNVTRLKTDTGFAQETWADSAIVWANAESKLPPSNETVIDGKNTAKNISDFTIRYTTGISEQSRVIWNDKLYQVKNIKVSHDRRFISFQGEFYDSYILTGVSLAAFITANAALSADAKVIHNILAAMNAIATTNAEIIVSQQGLVEAAASLSASGNLSADATKVIPINSDVTANGTLTAAVTKAINIDSTLNANATLVSDALVSKTLSSTLNANATTSAAVDVVTQGSVSVDAALNALGTVAAEIKRTVTLVSSSSTSATTELNATLTKVIEASATATANTQSAAQLTIPINAAANATANTTADATLSYTVNAELNATAQTTFDAQITRIISAEMTATAQTSVEAGVGVTFVSSLMATGSVTNAELFRTAKLAASVTGAATVTNSNLQLFDPNFANVSLLLHGNGSNNGTVFTDNSPNGFTITRNNSVVTSTTKFKFGTASLRFPSVSGDYLTAPDNTDFVYGTGDFTIEFFFNVDNVSGIKHLYDQRPLSTDGAYFTFRLNGNSCEYVANSAVQISGGTVVADTWYHVAISRSGTSTRLYFNGSQIGSTYTDSTNYLNGTGRPMIGGSGYHVTTLGYLGYIDDLRITKGVARYTGTTLTIPTSEFLDQ